MTKPPKVIYKFDAVSTKPRMVFFTICMETQQTLNNQSNVEKEKQSWRNQLSCFRLYYELQSSRQYGAGTKTDKQTRLYLYTQK